MCIQLHVQVIKPRLYNDTMDICQFPYIIPLLVNMSWNKYVHLILLYFFIENVLTLPKWYQKWRRQYSFWQPTVTENEKFRYIPLPEEVGSKVLRNGGILPQHYTASQPRRPRLKSSEPWKPPISQKWDYVFTTKTSTL